MAKGKKKSLPKSLEKQLRAAGALRVLFNASFQRDMPKGVGTLESQFEDPLLLGGVAEVIQRLDPKDPTDGAILKAFEVAGLSPKNLFHWRAVMQVFCLHHFGKPKTKTVTWNQDAILKWYADCEEIKAKHPGITTATDLAKHLSRHHPDYKGKYKTDKSFRHLTKRIEEAYDPAKNLRLRYPEMSDLDLMRYRAALEDSGSGWTLGHERVFFDVSERLTSELGNRAELALSQHPEFKGLLKEATEHTKKLLESGVSISEAIRGAVNAQSVQSFINAGLDQLKQELDGDLPNAKAP